MSTDLTVATIGAAAVIIAALIGLIVALTTAVIAKEQKVAEFRQAWINELRNEVAVMLASIFSLLHELKFHNNHLAKLNMKISIEDKLEFNLKMKLIVESMYKINLRLNPDKDKNIINEINIIKGLINDILNNKNEAAAQKTIRNKVSNLSKLFHKSFKSEWERVKNGELLYKYFMASGKILVGVLLTTFFVLLLISNFPYLCSL